jgi:hypothetical protein
MYIKKMAYYTLENANKKDYAKSMRSHGKFSGVALAW